MVSFTLTLALATTAFAAVISQSSSSELRTVNGKQYFVENLGCYSDNYPDSRVLPDAEYSEPTYNTLARCAEFCADRGFTFSGAEFSRECFCGNTLPAIKLDESRCDLPCSVNESENCGGSNALTVQRITPVNSIGCYADEINFRSLDGPSFSAPDMTITKCASFCTDFANYGLEFGSECYCGNGLRLGPTDSGKCNMPCAGDASQICGGGNALSVYGSPLVASLATTQIGCFEDFYPQSRVLDGANTESDSMTDELCSKFCAQRAYTYFGTEFGRECFCGNTLPSITSTGCSQACAGDSAEICGGSNAINVYYYNANGAPSLRLSSSAAAASSTATPASSSIPVMPIVTSSVALTTSIIAIDTSLEPSLTIASTTPVIAIDTSLVPLSTGTSTTPTIAIDTSSAAFTTSIPEMRSASMPSSTAASATPVIVGDTLTASSSTLITSTLSG